MCGWLQGVIMHEVGHALGVIHEHQRNDRDDYVRILTENAYDVFTHLFAVYDPRETTSLDVTYDYSSVMQYHGKVRRQNRCVIKVAALSTMVNSTIGSVIGGE